MGGEAHFIVHFVCISGVCIEGLSGRIATWHGVKDRLSVRLLFLYKVKMDKMRGEGEASRSGLCIRTIPWNSYRCTRVHSNEIKYK